MVGFGAHLNRIAHRCNVISIMLSHARQARIMIAAGRTELPSRGKL
jgi:hypothetical protein